nr:protein TWIN SISTER of FT-like [Nicotiana tomentosiformis]
MSRLDPLIVSGVIGDVLDSFTRSVDFSAVYNNTEQVYNGCGLRPSQVVNQPRVDIGGDDLHTFYTLICPTGGQTYNLLCSYTASNMKLHSQLLIINYLYQTK